MALLSGGQKQKANMDHVILAPRRWDRILSNKLVLSPTASARIRGVHTWRLLNL
jgi:hypothetical protein